MENINESNFIDLLKKKEPKALEYAINTYSYVVKSVYLKIIYGNNEYLDDIYQETFMALWNNIENFDMEKSTFKSYLGGIARFKCLDLLKEILSKKDNEVDIENTVIKENFNLLESIYKRELESLLNGLSEENKSIIIDYYFLNRRVKDISKSKGLSLNSIYHRLNRSIEKLKKNNKLKEYLYDKDF